MLNKAVPGHHLNGSEINKLLTGSRPASNVSAQPAHSIFNLYPQFAAIAEPFVAWLLATRSRTALAAAEDLVR
jgi:hypothetical protein